MLLLCLCETQWQIWIPLSQSYIAKRARRDFFFFFLVCAVISEVLGESNPIQQNIRYKAHWEFLSTLLPHENHWDQNLLFSRPQSFTIMSHHASMNPRWMFPNSGVHRELALGGCRGHRERWAFSDGRRERPEDEMSRSRLETVFTEKTYLLIWRWE